MTLDIKNPWEALPGLIQLNTKSVKTFHLSIKLDIYHLKF